MTGGAADTRREFEELLVPVLDVAYRLALRYTRNPDDAGDLVQDAALQAFRAFHQFTRGTNFRAWFLRILTHAFYARYRKRQREPVSTAIEETEPLYLYDQSRARGLPVHLEDPATLVIDRLDGEEVGRAIDALPEEFRTACALYFLGEGSYLEIAEALGCPVGTVRSRLHRGRRLLQRALWRIAEVRGLAPAPSETSEAGS